MKRVLLVLALFVNADLAPAEGFFLKKFSAKDGEVSPKQIHDVIEDQRGIVYVADETGVLEYDGIQWRKISMPEDGPAQALATDDNGRVYVAGVGEIGFLTPDSNGRMEFKSLSQHLKPEQKEALSAYVQVQTLGSQVAFVTDRQIFLLQDNQIREFNVPNDIYTTLGLKNQLLIVDSKEGLLSLKDNAIKPVDNGKFFSASALFVDKEGRMLGGSLSDGLIELIVEQGRARFHGFPRQDKSALMGSSITRVRSLNDKVFVATIGRGLNVYSSKTGQSLPIPDKVRKDLGSDIVALAADSHGRVWVGTRSGMFVLTDSEATVTSKGKEQKTTEDKPDFYAYVRSCVSMKDNEVIFGGAFFQELGGVQTLEASSLNRPELPFNQNALRFGYASSDLVNAEAIEYQTFLLGYDSEWTEWSNRNYREFTNLVWKNYVFQVKARRANGAMSPIAVFELKIMPPWYERYWFYLVQLGILIALVLLVTYLKGWTNKTATTDKLNGVVVGTIWGYSFSKVGVQGVVWAMSGGAAFLAIITNAFMGIFLKPLQKKLEAKIIRLEDNLIHKVKSFGQAGNSMRVDETIRALKLRPRHRPGPKSYPPRHNLKPKASPGPKRQVTRLSRPKAKSSPSFQKSA